MPNARQSTRSHVWRVPSDTRELMLALDPSRADVPQPVREAAATWARQWMDSEPDAIIVLGLNARARNRDAGTRQMRLRRLGAALQRQGVPADRIRWTTTGLQTPVCSQAGERGVAWLKVLPPIALERGVVQIDSLFGERTTTERAT